MAGLRRVSILFLCFGLTACGSSRLPVPEQGRNITFDSGSPLVDVEVLPRQVDGGATLQVTWGVIPASLVRVKEDGSLQALIRSSIDIRPKDATGEATSFARSDTLQFASELEAGSYMPALFDTAMALSPGRYEVFVSIEDLASRAVSRLSVDIELPSNSSAAPGAGSVHIGRPDDARPVVSFHYPAEFDSIRVGAGVWGEVDERRLRLVRFQSDTTVAEAPLWPTGLGRDIVATGVTLRESEVLVDVTWSEGTPGEERSVTAAGLEPGYYRATLTLDDVEAARRDFVVREPGFPSVDRLSVMVDALEYIATEEELTAIRGAEGEGQMKASFDAFWGATIAERARAGQTIAQYYERVEEANRLFSGVKDGWKTDRGMIYIIRGAPMMVETSMDREIWYYSYREPTDGEIYVFDNTSIPGLDRRLRTYTLRRHVLHAAEWRRAVDQWRRGRPR